MRSATTVLSAFSELGYVQMRVSDCAKTRHFHFVDPDQTRPAGRTLERVYGP